MDRILEQSGSRSLISNLSIVELESVLAIKTRTGEINRQSLEIARRVRFFPMADIHDPEGSIIENREADTVVPYP